MPRTAMCPLRPVVWFSWRRSHRVSVESRAGQLARAVRLTLESSRNGATASIVITGTVNRPFFVLFEQDRADEAKRRRAPSEWNGNHNDQALLMLGVPS